MFVGVLGDTFRTYDLDGDGELTIHELVARECRLGDCSRDSVAAQAKTCVSRYDRDGSLTISRLEFLEKVPRDPIEAGPQQVHLSLTGNPTEMVVMWVTRDTDCSEAHYGLTDLSDVTTGTEATYDVGVTGWSGWIHTVVLTGLTPSTTYNYAVGCSSTSAGLSETFTFTTAPAAPTAGPRYYAVVADQGTYIPMGWAVIDQVVADHKTTPFSLALHAGDVCYAGTGAVPPPALEQLEGTTTFSSHWEFEEIWDQWENLVQPIAAYIPYHFAVGNHERFYNFTAYRTRFLMPADENGEHNFWYSMDYDNIHFVFFSTEHPYTPGSPQYTWLTADLAAADANRATVPWIIMLGHRPMYSSDTNEWNSHEPGAPFQVIIEPVMHQYGVNLYLCGHMHMYERVYPVLNGTVTNTGNVWVNPVGIPHVNQATAGVFLDDDYIEPQPAWSAMRTNQWGYGRMTVFNNTHLYYEFMDESTYQSIDYFWIIQTGQKK